MTLPLKPKTRIISCISARLALVAYGNPEDIELFFDTWSIEKLDAEIAQDVGDDEECFERKQIKKAVRNLRGNGIIRAV